MSLYSRYLIIFHLNSRYKHKYIPSNCFIDFMISCICCSKCFCISNGLVKIWKCWNVLLLSKSSSSESSSYQLGLRNSSMKSGLDLNSSNKKYFFRNKKKIYIACYSTAISFIAKLSQTTENNKNSIWNKRQIKTIFDMLYIIYLENIYSSSA